MKKPIVLISGAGIGIGRGTALAFAAEGYKVIVSDVLEKEGVDVAKLITENGGEADFCLMDVTNTDQVNSVVSKIEDISGPLDTLICNAGIAKKIPLDSMTDKEWDLTIDINLKGMMRMIRAASPGMKAQKKGTIVCLASVVGTVYGWDEHIPYSATKAGVSGLVKATAIELVKHQIRSNGIAPGFIRTAQTLDPIHSVGEEGLNAVAPSIPLGRIGDPSDIADVAVFLASNKARYITGQTITVDAGVSVAL